MKTGGLLALCAVVALSGCNRGSPPSTAGSAPAVRRSPTAKQGPSVAEQTAGMVEAASPVKSTVPVRLKFELMQRPAVGQPLVIDLAVVPLAAADAATVDIADSTDFNVPAGDREFTVGSMEPNTAYRHSISVTPANGGGVSQLDVSVTLHRDEITEVRRFAVPIIVDAGSGDAAASAAAGK